MSLSLDQLEAFALAAKLGSFSAAARHLGKAHSGVSTAIANLETDLDLMLFDRSGKCPVLTDEGATLLREAETILARCRAFSSHAHAVSGTSEARIRFAVDELIPRKVLIEAMQEFDNAFPYTELEIRFGSMDDISELVSRQEVDFGLLMPLKYPEREFEVRLAGHMPFRAYAGKDHPLSSIKDITPTHLEQHLQLVTISRSSAQDSKAPIWGNNIWKLESSSMIRELVIHGNGWTILPECLMSNDVSNGTVMLLEINHSETSFACPIYLIWERGQAIGPATSWLMDNFARLFSTPTESPTISP